MFDTQFKMPCHASCGLQPTHVAVGPAVCSTHRAVVCRTDGRTLTHSCSVLYFTSCAREWTLVILARICVVKEKNYLTAYLAMWGLEAQMSARSLGPNHGLYVVLQCRSRQWLQHRHSPLRNVNHLNEYKQVSLTDTLVLAGLNSRKVVSVSLAPSINEPLALLGGWIEEEAWKVTKTGSTSRRKITHWERKTKWKITP